MDSTRSIARILAIGIAASFAAGHASGQNYPNKPIRIVTSTPGGSADIVARLLAQGLTVSLSQQVLVDNRAGVIAGEIVAKAPPDGYTLLVTGNLLWTVALMQKVAYDPVADFLPISLTHMTPMALVVHPSLPVKSVKELIAIAKAKPGQLNYAAGAPGSTNHLPGELFKAMAGVNIVGINYKGGGPALNAVIGGEVPMMFISAVSVIPYVKSGRLKALAVTSAQPSALLPGLPTIASAGLTEYRYEIWLGLMAPAKTPAAIINRLHTEIAQSLNRPEAKEKFFNMGLETVASSPEEFATAIKSDMTKIGKVIRDGNIKGE